MAKHFGKLKSYEKHFQKNFFVKNKDNNGTIFIEL